MVASLILFYEEYDEYNLKRSENETISQYFILWILEH